MLLTAAYNYPSLMCVERVALQSDNATKAEAVSLHDHISCDGQNSQPLWSPCRYQAIYATACFPKSTSSMFLKAYSNTGTVLWGVVAWWRWWGAGGPVEVC
jgi:hypothetical protein